MNALVLKMVMGHWSRINPGSDADCCGSASIPTGPLNVSVCWVPEVLTPVTLASLIFGAAVWMMSPISTSEAPVGLEMIMVELVAFVAPAVFRAPKYFLKVTPAAGSHTSLVDGLPSLCSPLTFATTGASIAGK